MLRWLFGLPRFNSSFVKAELTLAISRAKLNRKKYVCKKNGLKREIAALLRENREENARIKAEQYLQICKSESAMELLEIICDLIITRMAYLEKEKACPEDVLPAIHSVVYASTRSGLAELVEVTKHFESKYGREFVKRALENSASFVHHRLIEFLDVTPPCERELIGALRSAATDFNVEWTSPIDVVQEEDFVPTPGQKAHVGRTQHSKNSESETFVTHQRDIFERIRNLGLQY